MDKLFGVRSPTSYQKLTNLKQALNKSKQPTPPALRPAGLSSKKTAAQYPPLDYKPTPHDKVTAQPSLMSFGGPSPIHSQGITLNSSSEADKNLKLFTHPDYAFKKFMN